MISEQHLKLHQQVLSGHDYEMMRGHASGEMSSKLFLCSTVKRFDEGSCAVTLTASMLRYQPCTLQLDLIQIIQILQHYQIYS